MDDRMLNVVEKAEENDNDEETTFCTSLIPTLKNFEKKKLSLANIKIQVLLYDTVGIWG